MNDTITHIWSVTYNNGDVDDIKAASCVRDGGTAEFRDANGDFLATVTTGTYRSVVRVDALVEADVVDEEHPETTCHRCFGPNLPWCAPSPLWNEVMRQGDINNTDLELHSGIICPTCFMVLAEEAGIAELWRLSAIRVHRELQTVTPSGRVWNEQTWMFDEPQQIEESK